MNFDLETVKKKFKENYLKLGKFEIGYKDLKLSFVMKIYNEYLSTKLGNTYKNFNISEKKKFEEIKNDKKKLQIFLKEIFSKKIDKKDLIKIMKQSEIKIDKFFKKYKLNKNQPIKLKQLEDIYNFKVFSKKELKELKEMKEFREYNKYEFIKKNKAYFVALRELSRKFKIKHRHLKKMDNLRKNIQKKFITQKTLLYQEFNFFLNELNNNPSLGKYFFFHHETEFINELSKFLFKNIKISTRKNSKLGMTMWQFEYYFKYKIIPEIKRKFYFTHYNMDRPLMVLIQDNDVEIYSRTRYDEDDMFNKDADKTFYSILENNYKNVKKIYIGKDLRDSSKHSVGNTVLIQLNSRKFNLISDSANNEFYIQKGDKIIDFFSPLEGSDIPCPYIIGEKNVYILNFYHYKFLKREPYLNKYSDKKSWISEDFIDNVIMDRYGKFKKYMKKLQY